MPIEDLAGATIIVQRQGKSLISFQFTDATASYGSQPLSVLSSHLLNDPTDLSIRRATSTDETDRLFLVNGGDGSMAVYSILQAQNVIAPSKFTTDGEFVAVVNELSDTFVIVKRTINSSTVYYLEKFNESLTLDSAKTGAGASSVTMAHLNGKTVEIERRRSGAFSDRSSKPSHRYVRHSCDKQPPGRIRLQCYLEDYAGGAEATAGHCPGHKQANCPGRRDCA